MRVHPGQNQPFLSQGCLKPLQIQIQQLRFSRFSPKSGCPQGDFFPFCLWVCLIKFPAAGFLPVLLEIHIRPADPKGPDTFLRKPHGGSKWLYTAVRAHRHQVNIAEHISMIILRNIIFCIVAEFLVSPAGMPELDHFCFRTLFTGSHRKKIITDHHILRPGIIFHEPEHMPHHCAKRSILIVQIKLHDPEPFILFPGRRITAPRPGAVSPVLILLPAAIFLRQIFIQRIHISGTAVVVGIRKYHQPFFHLCLPAESIIKREHTVLGEHFTILF